MKDVDYDSATCLQDIYEIEKKICDGGLGPTWHRNEALMECARDSESVMELGVNQGTAFILMLLQNPKKMIGVDITTKKWYNGGTYKPLSVLADAYAKENNIEIEMLEMSSTDKRSTRKVDMIHIDSLHTGSHLKKELDLHAQHVKKYIAFHDIKQNNYELWKVVQKFLDENQDTWKLKNMYDKRGKCGHAEIERIR